MLVASACLKTAFSSPPARIESLLATHISGVLSPCSDTPSSEHDTHARISPSRGPLRRTYSGLLEEQVLVATDAQETRDMIRILANLYKSRGDAVPSS